MQNGQPAFQDGFISEMSHRDIIVTCHPKCLDGLVDCCFTPSLDHRSSRWTWSVV